uniref:Uncharacterized protein n=1 Tax=Leersia perrieri TaxID=77586 RepID=A0A0D9X9K7_9ORYZ
MFGFAIARMISSTASRSPVADVDDVGGEERARHECCSEPVTRTLVSESPSRGPSRGRVSIRAHGRLEWEGFVS